MELSEVLRQSAYDVLVLNLAGQGLCGPIPPEILHFLILEKLDLCKNQLTGTIPPAIGQLDSLTDLDLTNNSLDGPIPPELATLTSLTMLCLGRNQLSGRIPPELGKLTLLKELDLSGNQFSGPIPSELGQLTLLTGLALSRNQLSEHIPEELSQLNQLELLLLSDNQLTGPIPPWIGKISSLKDLDLTNNRLDGPLPPDLVTLTSLTVLCLGRNQLSGRIPPKIGELTLLKDLDLSSNQFSGPIPSELGQLTSLTGLALSHNKLSGLIPEELAQLTLLKLLLLSDNQLTGSIPLQLTELTSLTTINLSQNQLSGPVPPELAQLTSLTNLTYQTLLWVAPDVSTVQPFPVTSSCFVGSTHSQLLPYLGEDIAMVQRVQSESQVCLLQELSENSLWRFWIPVCYWLMGQDLPAELKGWGNHWSLNTQGVQQMLLVADSLIVPSFHGSIFHLMAQFGLDESVLLGTPVGAPSLALLHQQDHYGRTPLLIIRQLCREEERNHGSSFLPLLTRCAGWLQRVELMEAKAKQDREQLEYTKEDALLRSQLEGISITRTMPRIEGHLRQCEHLLEQHWQDHPLLAEDNLLFFRCALQLRQAAMLHWKGPQHADQTILNGIHALLPNISWGSRLVSSPPSLLNRVLSSLSEELASQVVAELLKTEDAYHSVLEWCRSPCESLVEGTWLHDVDLGSVLLTEEAASKLMPEGALITEMDYGHHVVITHAGMHFKCLKDSGAEQECLLGGLPGMEFMVDRLAKLTVGHGTAPSRLVKITKGDRHITMQVSRTVEGTTLDWVLTHHPEWIEKLEARNVAEITLVGLLTNPADGKADNYMVEVEYEVIDGVKQVKHLHLVGIDNDMAFADPIRKLPGDEKDFCIHVRSVVFLLPTMDQPIHPDSRIHFLSLPPDLTLLEWLKALEQRNRKYRALRKENIFTEEDYGGDPRDPSSEGLQLPISIPQYWIERLYKTMVEIQAFMTENANATLHDIFARVQPTLAEAYHKQRHSGKSILEQVHNMYDLTMKQHLEAGQKVPRKPEDRQRLYSLLIYESSKSQSKSSIKLSVAKAVEEVLTQLPPERIEVLFETRIFDELLLPNPTSLMHVLLSKGLLTRASLLFLLSRGANVTVLSSIPVGDPPEKLRRYPIPIGDPPKELRQYPVQLAIGKPTTSVVDLVRELINAGSPVHVECDSGSTESFIQKFITDEDIKQQLLSLCGDSQK